MSDSDGEFELLDPNHTVQTIGEHELKTSPLVTRDAIGVSEQFAQRGLLGTVLSVHANGLPAQTDDPRIYLNLDAPSSGLVCGVQGSGKSHTVSCILESSLMSSSRIGALPAPLGTVVFHFDEENGERPCEAAYLSELKDRRRGVEEVLVLVSPSNLRTRRRVYSSLKFVRVEPLRIAEQDLNATRMLSMMGADNLETLPLYMHTILSILREMGSDNFNYRDFQKRLKDPEFNKSQSAMLELRLDLLDSFLQGDGPDVKSFFKPGRLVILDISDPFVESTTAAMLFDICLGLFIEWKSSTGKLIVLDEAHKYLTNADANRFTKSICSIIRQQRHLAARVIVSTQEPTVVPASVLDLLSWIVCHRFSSPGWVKHLKHHICAEEEEDHERTGRNSDWGKRVMMLRTGEALLYSPASLFATDDGEMVTLSSGYAIIKTRSRLTSDGGASLLATQTHDRSFIDTGASLPTPPLSDNLLPTTFPMSPRILSSLIPPNTPIPRIIDLVASTSATHSSSAGITFGGASSLIPPSAPSFMATAQPASPLPPHVAVNNVALVPITKPIVSRPPSTSGGVATASIVSQSTPNISSVVDRRSVIGAIPNSNATTTLSSKNLFTTHHPVAKPIPLQGPAKPALAPNASIPSTSSALKGRSASYTLLIRVMNRLYQRGIVTPTLTLLGEEFRKEGSLPYTGKLYAYLQAAQGVGLVKLLGTKDAASVELRVEHISDTDDNDSSSSGSSESISPIFQALLSMVAGLEATPGSYVPFSSAALALAKKQDGDFKAAGYKRFKNLVGAAEDEGLVETICHGGSGFEMVRSLRY